MTFAILLAALLPAWEMLVVDREPLTAEQRALLIAIRRAENGIPPYYYGVADRRADTYAKQCRWTANTIRKRYDGNLSKFAARWCPTNAAVWLKNVRWFMKVQMKGISK